MNERSRNSTSEIMNSEHVAWAVSWIAQKAIEGAGVAAEKLKKDTLTSLSSGYVISFTEQIQELFRQEWVIPCLGTRIVL